MIVDNLKALDEAPPADLYVVTLGGDGGMLFNCEDLQRVRKMFSRSVVTRIELYNRVPVQPS